jgi:hypothetical protein
MDLDEAADILYGLPIDQLEEFGTRRGELVKQARAAGDRELATKIGKFKKPIQSAALANTLVRSQHDALAELRTLAVSLRDAHRHLRGEELRQLSERRQQVLSKLTELGRKASGSAVSETALGQLRATFEAAIADANAERAVLSGRLTTALNYSGFGEVDISDAVAVPRRLAAVPDPPRPKASPADERRPAQQTQADRRPAEQALASAEQAHSEALDEVDSAVSDLDAARDHERELGKRIERLEAELATARAESAKATKQTAAAEREHRRAARALERVELAVQGARDDLAELAED